MRFRDPWFFLLFIPLAWACARAYAKMLGGNYAAALKTPWSRLWGQGERPSVPPRFVTLMGYAIAAALLVAALARPQTSYQKVKHTTEGIDIMVVLDLSASMRVEDFRDNNRLDVAKSVIRDFIAGRQSDRIGLVTFSGEAVTLAPPTLDYNLVLQQLDNVEIGELKDGTAIGEGLALGVTRLNTSKAKTKIIILVTDGDNNMGQIDPGTAGEMAKGFGIKVYSVAIGREGRVRMPFVQKDIFGRSFRTYQYYDSSINPALLKQISEHTGGKFYRVEGDTNAFRDVFREIDALERTKVTSQEQVKYDEKYMAFVAFALAILAATFLLQNTVLRVYP
jgi:Ca-activated chloride channel family protein